MELNIDQALQQGDAAYNEGNVQNAERLYRAVLQAEPSHPHANHKLGEVAVAVGKPLEAIPLFKLAVEAKPQIEQFWLSYIEALMRAQRFDEAERVVAKGEESGVSPGKLEILRQQIRASSLEGNTKTKKGLAVSEKRKRLAEKKRKKKKRAQNASLGASPSQDQINLFLEHYRANRMAEAESIALSLAQQFPGHPFAWKALGVVYQQTSRPRESLGPMQKSVELSPHDAEAHFNLGVTLRELGRLEEAEASYLQAIALEPDYAEAYNSLGVTLQELGRLEDAISSYISSINLRAGPCKAHSNLGRALISARFKKANKSLYPILINLLAWENVVMPQDVAGAIVSLLRLDNLIADLLLHPPIFTDVKEVDRAVKALDQIPLLHQLMRICPLPDLQLEELFVFLRQALLRHLNTINDSPEVTNFLLTLSLQCFTNEYVYAETEVESALVDSLETKVAECLAQGSQPTITEVLCLAAYRPLHHYDWSDELQALEQFPEAQKRLIDEPQAETVIAQSIPCLADVEDEISRKVKEQYEENPYPRWMKFGAAPKAKSVAEVCIEAELKLHSANIKSVVAPKILIAGCGTGMQSLGTASRFANCHITAVDLSRASLAYAQRKTDELGITNIQYLQADILNLDELGQKFDIIESAGVLHHMDDPMAGWRVLTDLLNSSGLMKIGLYSELARHHVVRIREEIVVKGLEISDDEIRQFRRSLIESPAEHHQRLTSFYDFFTLSSLRDLIFHVQEHRFTLPQIQICLDELGLKFCGFESPEMVANFKKSFGEEADTCDLLLWHQFEKQNPKTFLGMYQFWCQKR